VVRSARYEISASSSKITSTCNWVRERSDLDEDAAMQFVKDELRAARADRAA